MPAQQLLLYRLTISESGFASLDLFYGIVPADRRASLVTAHRLYKKYGFAKSEGNLRPNVVQPFFRVTVVKWY